MNMHACPAEDKTDWLTDAILAVNKLPENNKVDRARNETARKLLRSIEAIHIVPPVIRKSTTTGGVYIRFTFQARSVEFFVTHPNIVTIRRFATFESGSEQVIHGHPGQAARDALSWVFPACNRTTEAEMMAELERVTK